MFPISAKVKVRNMERPDYESGPSFTKEFFLIGKDNKEEKLRMMEKTSLFNKKFKVIFVDIYFWLLKYISKNRCLSVASLDVRMSH